MFAEIWEERKHISEISGKPLLYPHNSQWHWQFAHVLGKQAYPRYAERKENIMLMLPEEHEKQESFTTFMEKKQELIEKYYRNE
jgi:hypothetical protein